MRRASPGFRFAPSGLRYRARRTAMPRAWTVAIALSAIALSNGPAHAQPAEPFFAHRTINIFMQWHSSKVQSIEDSRRLESSLAGTGPGSIAETVPRLLNALAGTKFKLVSGYPASTQAMLAMERGEVEGASSSWAAVSVSKKDWLRDKKIRIILQTAPTRMRELPDAPALPEIGATPEDKQVYQLYASGSAVGRSLIGPPGIPADRV